MEETSAEPAPVSGFWRLFKPWWAKVLAGVVAFGAVLSAINGVFELRDHVDPSQGTAPSPSTSIEGAPGPTSSPEASAGSDGYPGGWGPERPTHTIAAPASYAILNTITDHPIYGDLRNFTRVRNLTTSGENGDYLDMVRGNPGDIIELLAVVSNSAADNLDGSAATIHDLHVRLANPDTGRDLSISVVLEGSNAITVWDGATVVTPGDARLSVQEGVTFTSNAGTYELAADFRDGHYVPLGWSSADGELPVGYDEDGRYRGFGYVIAQLEVIDTTD